MRPPESKWGEREVGRVVDYVGRSERHRVGFVAGVSLLFFLLTVVRSPFGGLVPLGCTIVVVVLLYTRPSARATVTAGATVPGLAVLALFLYRVVGFGVAVGGYEPFTSVVRRNVRLLGTGTALLALGVWLRRVTS